VFASRAAGTLAGDGVTRPAVAARALARGQAQAVLHSASRSHAAAIHVAVHAASVSGLQGGFLVAGLAGVMSGLVVLAVVRRPRPAEAAPAAPAAARAPVYTNPPAS
jgi:hypothetical protein